VEAAPAFPAVPVELQGLGSLLDERSYPAEIAPSAAAVAALDGRIAMPAADGRILEFRPLRIEMTSGGEVSPVRPPFLGAVDVLLGELGTTALFDGGVFLGSTQCLADDLPSVQVVPAPDPPPGGGFFFLARPSLPGADYGPSSEGVRRVAPAGGDCTPSL
jgi:hypothetical protein